MGRTNLTQQLLDRAIEGGLERYLTERRAAGDSYATIAAALLEDHDVGVTRETVRLWCTSLDIVKAEPEAAAS